jgi:seryl-tRNA synthetase
MTDNEIIECAENCISEKPPCISCPFDEDTYTTDECMGKLVEKLVEVVNRQKAEIDILIQRKNAAYDEIAELKADVERLKDDKNRLEKMMDNLSKDLDAQMIRNF